PIGRPIAHTRAYVLDRWGGLAAPGAVGELALAGVGVARGYLRRPALTARKFVADPFVGGRMYRTGDLVRLRVRGDDGPPLLEFLGRIDAQVKIRGHRVEPAEIEHALRALPGVGDAVVTVLAAEDAAAARLVAYVSPRRPDDDTNDLADRLQAELRASLPAHLVPSALVVLRALPFTLSGKVDLRALPPPSASSAAPAGPRNDVERRLVEIWCAALGLERVGIHDNFFALGGDSVLGIQVVARAQEAGIGLRAGQLFEQQTIAELAAAADDTALLGEADSPGPAPLTPIQRWFLEQDADPGHVNHFNQAILLEVPADLEPAHVAAVLAHLQAHHAALRLRFTRGADGWSQAVLADAVAGPPPLAQIDLAGADDRPAALAAAAAHLHATLDITAGPIQRALLIRLGPGEPARLLWVIHHLAVDAVSWRILVPDLAAGLRQLAAGEPVALPPPTTSFKHWAARLHELAAADPFTGERAALAAPPPRPLPIDRPHAANDRAGAATVQVRLDAATTRSLLRDALRPYNLAAQDILLTALAQAVARWTGDPAVWIDLEGHGREDLFQGVDLSRTVGWFTALYPVRLALPADDDPGDALVAVKEQLRGVPRRGVGFGLLRYLHPD
ncbi:MAG: AMP-binding protein, partial [Myxococcales bacterium]|nr:AMP-binding protein [Myxococcales bacterium]